MLRRINIFLNASGGFSLTGRILCWTAFLLLLYAVPALGADHIILYRAGTTDNTMWNNLKKYMTNKGYTVSAYEAPETIEKQVETANRINREKARFTLVLELVPSERPDAFIVISDAKKGKGMILDIEEVPGSHRAQSEELASFIAAQFQKKVKTIPLFMLLGIDMPGVFIRLDTPKDRPSDAFNRLHDGIQNYTKRGFRDERERKGERRNTQP